jgi:hypothetical protein
VYLSTTFIVIGSGPAGQKAAVGAAKAHNRVAVIDRTTMIGGVCVHTGTISSRTVREAIFPPHTPPFIRAAGCRRYRLTRALLKLNRQLQHSSYLRAGFQAHGGSRRGTLHGGSTSPETVIVSDVALDAKWDAYGWRTAALTHGLRACWSTRGKLPAQMVQLPSLEFHGRRLI